SRRLQKCLRHYLTANQIILIFLQRRIAEIIVRVVVIPQKQPSVQPHLQEFRPRVTLPSNLQFPLVHKPNRPSMMRLQCRRYPPIDLLQFLQIPVSEIIPRQRPRQITPRDRPAALRPVLRSVPRAAGSRSRQSSSVPVPTHRRANQRRNPNQPPSQFPIAQTVLASKQNKDLPTRTPF